METLHANQVNGILAGQALPWWKHGWRVGLGTILPACGIRITRSCRWLAKLAGWHARYLADAWFAGLQQHAQLVCRDETEALESLRDRYRR